MRIVPTLLRVILALSLILNGTGLATAHAGAVDTQAPTALASASVPETPGDGAPPCHDVPDPIDTGHGSHHGNADGGTATPGTADHHAGTDCCELGTCDNACPQPLSAALVAATVAGPHARPNSLPQAMSGDRPGPLLPHPIRPPIA